MTELLLAVRTDDGDLDIAVRFDDRTTVGALVDRLVDTIGAPASGTCTLERRSRSRATLSREARLAHEDLRSGDLVQLGIDTGLRERERTDVVGRVRITEPGRPPRVLDVVRGEMVIGRSPACELPITDDLASRRHAKLVASDIIEVVDLGSTNGTTVNDVGIVTPQRLRSGDRIRIGDTVLSVDQADAGAASLGTTGNVIEFNRPPRIDPPFAPVEVELPAPPDRPRKQRLPMIMAAAPVLMGVVLFLVTGSLYSIMFIALSPVMMLGSWYESRRSGRADFTERLAQYEADLDGAIGELDRLRDLEVETRFASAPAVGELDEHVQRLSARLWERQPGDRDHLDLRVGLAPQPSSTSIKVPTGGARDLRERLTEVPEEYAQLPAVPVTLPLEEIGNLGVAGPSPYAAHVARALVAQACALHSPSEVVVCALLGESGRKDWAWLKWLPHARSNVSPVGEQHLAFTVDANLDVLGSLQQVIADRRDGDAPTGPQVLVVIDDAMPLERNRLSGLLDAGPDVGIHVLWVSATSRRLPKACRGVVDITPAGDRATVAYVTRNDQIEDVTLDLLDTAAATQLARDLAPIIDVSSRQSRDAEIPRMVSMVDLLGGPRLLDDPEEVLGRWKESLSGQETAGLRVPIGADSSGVFSLDLRHDGPHGLVAGTTGAGKSELLQSLLVGLAVTHSPQRVTFLLVDYKGGSAFKDCVRLPHTVGLVTDLTPALVMRALTSLRAELHRRERLLNEANAKDLLAMAASGHPDTPPSLVIVVDEFAALAREVPEFVDGVVDIAQRGRSLGLHLLLATQRPQGVITDNIRANTNLKIALRVASEAESNDVIDAPVAGQIERSLSGRGVARLGPSDLISFQTGYVGGHTRAGDDTPTLDVAWFDPVGRRPWPRPADDQVAGAQDTDLERLVVTVRAAFDAAGDPPPRRPWLDPLHPRYDLLRLPRGGSDRQLPIGVADQPDRQWQDLAVFEPDRDGSLLVYGAGGAGKTVALRTIAASAALTDPEHPVHIYGIDAAGRGLDLLTPLPQVGTVMTVDDHDRVTRLLGDLGDLLDHRSGLLGRYRASTLPELRTNGAGEVGPLPRIVLLVDGFENFQASYEQVQRGRWYDLLLRLAVDGRATGIHLVMTGSRRTSFPMLVTSSVGRRLILRLATQDEYAMMGVPDDLVDGDEPPGRAVDGHALTQIAMVGTRTDTPGQADALRELGARLQAAGGPKAPAVEVLPETVAADGLLTGDGDAGLVIGLDDRLRPLALTDEDHLIIAGPPRSGRTNAIAAIATAAAAGGRDVVILAGRRQVPHVPTGIVQHVGEAEVSAAVDALAAGPKVPLVLIDDLDRLMDGAASFSLEQLLQRDEVVGIVACDVNAARRYSSLITLLRRSRRAFLLAPDPDLDGELAGAPIPRGLRAFPPGRGLACDGGQLTVAQFALVGPADS